MPKLLTCLIALVLVPGLFVDPALATGLSPQPACSTGLSLSPQAFFAQQALSAAVADVLRPYAEAKKVTSQVRRGAAHQTAPAARASDTKKSTRAPIFFQRGMTVFHDSFGNGEVKFVSENSVGVQFGKPYNFISFASAKAQAELIPVDDTPSPPKRPVQKTVARANPSRTQPLVQENSNLDPFTAQERKAFLRYVAPYHYQDPKNILINSGLPKKSQAKIRRAARMMLSFLNDRKLTKKDLEDMKIMRSCRLGIMEARGFKKKGRFDSVWEVTGVAARAASSTNRASELFWELLLDAFELDLLSRKTRFSVPKETEVFPDVRALNYLDGAVLLQLRISKDLIATIHSEGPYKTWDELTQRLPSQERAILFKRLKSKRYQRVSWRVYPDDICRAALKRLNAAEWTDVSGWLRKAEVTQAWARRTQKRMAHAIIQARPKKGYKNFYELYSRRLMKIDEYVGLVRHLYTVEQQAAAAAHAPQPGNSEKRSSKAARSA